MKSKGFTIVEGVILLVVVAIIGFSGAFVNQKHRGITKINTATNAAGDSVCKVTDGIKFCAESSASIVAPTDDLTIKATLQNQTSEDYKTPMGYSSSCNDPAIKVNGVALNTFDKVCTQDLTSITIGAGKTRSYTLPIDTAKLKEGSNTIGLVWDKFSTDQLTVTLKAKTAADQAKEQGCLKAQSKLSYCATVYITFKGWAYQEGVTKCDELDTYIKPLGLAAMRHNCDLTSGYGTFTVSVPKDDEESWIARIRQLDSVENASDIN